MKKHSLCVALVLAFASFAGSALAQDQALSEAVFRDGRALMKEGKITAACAKFAESYRLDPKLGSLLNLAACHEQEGRLATAWIEYTEVANAAERSHQADREQIAREKVQALEKRLSRVSLEADGTHNGEIAITLDARALATASLGTALPLDPGPHRLEVSAVGKKTWTTTFEVPAGPSAQKIAIPNLEDAAAPAVAAAPADGKIAEPASPAQAHASDPPATRSQPRRVAAFGSIGLGAAGLGVGIFAGLRTLSLKDQAAQQCQGTVCSQQGLDQNASAHTFATVSTMAFGVGIVGIGLGTYLLLTDKAPASAPTRSGLAFPSITPSVDPHGAGLNVAGSFF